MSSPHPSPCDAVTVVEPPTAVGPSGVPTAGTIIRLVRKPRGVGGRNKDHGYRYDGTAADGSLKVYGPLRKYDGRWLPTNQAKFRAVPADQGVRP